MKHKNRFRENKDIISIHNGILHFERDILVWKMSVYSIVINIFGFHNANKQKL